MGKCITNSLYATLLASHHCAPQPSLAGSKANRKHSKLTWAGLSSLVVHWVLGTPKDGCCCLKTTPHPTPHIKNQRIIVGRLLSHSLCLCTRSSSCVRSVEACGDLLAARFFPGGRGCAYIALFSALLLPPPLLSVCKEPGRGRDERQFL